MTTRERIDSRPMDTRFDTKPAARQAVWDALSDGDLEAMPVLQTLRDEAV